MAYSHSRRRVFRLCALAYKLLYLAPVRPRKVTSEAQAAGSATDDLLVLLMTEIAEGRIRTTSEARAWLRSQVKDLRDEDGIRESLAVEGVNFCLAGMGEIQRVAKLVTQADSWTTQAQLWFDENWKRVEPKPGEEKWRLVTRAHVGGDLDIEVKKGRRAVVVDWKTGKRREDWSQLEDYVAFAFEDDPTLTEIEAWFAWLRFNTRSEPRTYTRGHLRTRRKVIESEIDEIESETEWKPTPGWHCGTCATPCEARHQRT